MYAYSCATEVGKYLAVIEYGGKRVDAKEAPSKFAAMALRDQARNARVAAFAHIDNPPPLAPPSEAKLAIVKPKTAMFQKASESPGSVRKPQSDF